MPGQAPPEPEESTEERTVEDAAGAAADLAQEDRDSTWVAIVRRHSEEIPRWTSERSEKAAVKQARAR